MMPKRIILVRHGRSEGNEDATMYSRVPDYKIALVAQGFEEARTAGRHVAEVIGEEPFGVYVSPYLWTMQRKECILSQIGHARAYLGYGEPLFRRIGELKFAEAIQHEITNVKERLDRIKR